VRQSNISLRMKKFELTQKARKVGSLKSLIGDLQALDYDLSLQIAAEEKRTKVSDRRRPEYSLVALAAAVRRSRLAATLEDLRAKLDVAMREHEEVAREVGDLEMTLARPATSTIMAHAEVRNQLSSQ